MKVSRYFIIGGEREDIMQEGFIGLYKAIKNYDTEKQNSFKSFANLCIERQLITAIKSSNRQKHMPLNSYLSLNMSAYDNEDDDVVVTLNLDDGSEVTCEILTIFDLDDQDYIVLLPLTEDGEENPEGEVYIYRYFEDETGAPSLDNIESDEEYAAVSAKFEEIYGEDFED